MNSRRSAQIGANIRRAVQETIARGLQDPRIRGVISVTDVAVAPDLRTARVKVSVFPEDAESLTMHGLRAASRHIRRRVGDLIAMQRVPELRFELDESLKTQRKVLTAIARASAELPENQPAEIPTPDPDLKKDDA